MSRTRNATCTCMILWQIDNAKIRERTLFLIFAKLLDKSRHPQHIRNFHIPPRICWWRIFAQSFHTDILAKHHLLTSAEFAIDFMIFDPIWGGWIIHLTIITKRESSSQYMIPNESAWRICNRVITKCIATTKPTKSAFQIGSYISFSRPWMAIGRIHTVAIIVIKDPKSICQGMMIWCDFAWKDAQPRSTTRFFIITEHLIKRAILFDYINNMFENTRLT